MINDIMSGLRVVTQEPFDARVYKLTEAELANLGANDNLAFSYVKMLKFICVEEKTEWEWREPKDGFETGLLANHFVYPNNWIKYGIDYSLQEYNFFPVKVILGAQSKGVGVPIYDGVSGGLIGISTLSSPNMLIEKLPDGTIRLTAPETNLDYLTAFYVNASYTPTLEAPSDGSIIRPYTNYDQARLAFIGTGTIIAPQFAGGVIILQTSSDATVNPTVNKLTVQFENNSVLTYIGTDSYMFDTEVLYPLIPKNVPRNDLTDDIYFALTGVGVISRNNGIGLVRGMGANRNGLGQVGDKFSMVKLGLVESDVITLQERTVYPLSVYDGDSSFANGDLYEDIYGTPHKYTLQLPPTVPLVYTQFVQGNTSYRTIACAGTVLINTVANTGVFVADDVLFFGNRLAFLVNGQLISTTSAVKLIDYPEVYQPHPNRNFYEGAGDLYFSEVAVVDSAGYSHIGVDSFFKFTNNAKFRFGVMKISSNMYVNKFINISDVSNTNTYFTLSDTSEGSTIRLTQGRYFLDTTEPEFTLRMPNTVVKPFGDRTTGVTNLLVETTGTLSSFFDAPVINLPEFTSKADAVTNSMIKGTLFRKTVTVAAPDLQGGIEYKVTVEGSPSLGAVGSYFTATGSETGTGFAEVTTLELL